MGLAMPAQSGTGLSRHWSVLVWPVELAVLVRWRRRGRRPACVPVFTLLHFCKLRADKPATREPSNPRLVPHDHLFRMILDPTPDDDMSAVGSDKEFRTLSALSILFSHSRKKKFRTIRTSWGMRRMALG